MYLLTNFITMLMIPIQPALQLPFSVIQMPIKFHVARSLMKMASNSRSNLCSI